METLTKDAPVQTPPAPVAPESKPIKPARKLVARVCALPGCNKTFTPDTESRRFHSEECAVASMRQNGKLPAAPPETPEPEAGVEQTRVVRAGKSKTAKAAKKVAKAQRREERSAQAVKTYGPTRKVTKLLKKNASSVRVLLECGHSKTLPSATMTQGPCQKCLNKSPKDGTAKAVKKGKK